MKVSRMRRIETFSAGCPACEEAIALVNRLAGESCEVVVLDMHEPEVAARARAFGIRTIPAVVVGGRLADCCAGRGVDKRVLRRADVGVPLS